MFKMLIILVVFLLIRHKRGLSAFQAGLAMMAASIVAIYSCPVAGFLTAIVWALLASGKPDGDS